MSAPRAVSPACWNNATASTSRWSTSASPRTKPRAASPNSALGRREAQARGEDRRDRRRSHPRKLVRLRRRMNPIRTARRQRPTAPPPDAERARPRAHRRAARPRRRAPRGLARRRAAAAPRRPHGHEPLLRGSTRTRTSFELAARRLGAYVVNFDIARSSTSKGESLEDTLATLEAMDADAFIVRQRTTARPRVSPRTRDARSSSTRATATMRIRRRACSTSDNPRSQERHEGLNVTICGDVRHSRVARSDIDGLTALGAAEIRLCGPAALLPSPAEFPGCRISRTSTRRSSERRRDHAAPAEGAHAERSASAKRNISPRTASRGTACESRKDAIVMHPDR